MPEQILDDVEGVLDPGPHLRQRSLDRFCQIPQAFWQCFDDAALDRDVPADVAVLMFGPLVSSGIAGIGEDILLRAVQHRRHLVDIGFVGGGALKLHRPALSPTHRQSLPPTDPQPGYFFGVSLVSGGTGGWLSITAGFQMNCAFSSVTRSYVPRYSNLTNLLRTANFAPDLLIVQPKAFNFCFVETRR